MPGDERILGGLTVVDLSVARAGPTTVRMLADWGASIVRVEQPGGDEGVVLDHESSDYINLHSNKRLLTLNLKHDDGRRILLRLLERADVLVENFRPQVKEKLGIGYEQVRERCPRLIYASISGFGQDGPGAHKGAVDQIIQGSAGLMSVTGTKETGPIRAGVAIADLAAGMILANAVLLALRERDASGLGQWVQVSLVEALITFLDFQAVRWTADHEVPDPVGNDHPTLSPMGLFHAADGFLNVAAPSDRLWLRLCDAMGADDLLDAPEFATAALRHRNREALHAKLNRVLGTRPRAAWVEVFEGAGVPCGPVNTIDEVFADPQVRHLAMTDRVHHAVRGPIDILRNPITMSRSGRAPRTAAPTPGQHTDELLHELGCTDDEVRALRASGTV
jgi:crotonobetainyl-CoA:carnitine CoA-transferase CaiB-like acyl-CoA transferase